MIDERYREWNRDHKTIRPHGAVGSLCRGIEITVHGMPSRLIAWPGDRERACRHAGTRPEQ